MSSESPAFDSVTTKLIACVAIIACLMLGVLGLLLPIVPGLLFIGIAAIVAAKLSPAVDRTLRRNATLAGYLDQTDGFAELALGAKLRLACLLGVEMLRDRVALPAAGDKRGGQAAQHRSRPR